MKRADALKEARRRWGDGAHVVRRIPSRRAFHREGPTHEVFRAPDGNGSWPNYYIAAGSGFSWEEAFADADRRGREP